MEHALARHPAISAFESAPARLTIDVAAVVENWRLLARLSGKARASVVVKADAYGLGARQIAGALYRAGCRDFFVATPDEGVEIRAVAPKARIFTLTGIWPGTEDVIFGNRLIPALVSLEQLAHFRSAGGDHPYALYVDTGMNRLGLTPAEAVSIAGEDGHSPILVMSHLACSDEAGHAMNKAQRESFQAVSRAFAGVESSLANSAGIFLGPDFHFDLTRPGIALYGGNSVSGQQTPTACVVTAEARILQIRNVRKGEAASYGATHIFDCDSRIAVIAAGYADGWMRSMSGAGVGARRDGSVGGSVLVAGEKAPIIGRITMDLTTVDISHIPDDLVRTGDYVQLFGRGICLEEAADAGASISYELLTSLGKRYLRRYV